MRPAFGGSAATWVLIQQVLVRGLVAVKFLAIGRMLGPDGAKTFPTFTPDSADAGGFGPVLDLIRKTHR